MNIETVKTDTLTMDYFHFGRGEDALVIVPGLSIRSVMESAGTIAHAYRALADRFTVYVFDRRQDLPSSYSVREMAQDTYEAIRALGLDRICMFGASQGGMIAMTIATEWPKLVRKLAVGSTAAYISEEQFHTLEKWIKLAKSGSTEELYLAFGAAILPPKTFEQLRRFLLHDAKAATDNDLNRFFVLAEGIQDFDILGDLTRIACPMLVIGSTDDQVLGSRAALQIAEQLSDRADFELHLYDGYGHAAYDLAPDYKERLLRFFSA